jgi:SAM-dependent methyltransferase
MPGSVLVPSRSLVMQLGPDGSIVARSSVSGPARELDADTVPILQAFAGGRTAAEAAAALEADFAIDAEEFAVVVADLVAAELLVPAGGDAVAPAPSPAEAFAAWSHFYMIKDASRVRAYRDAIARHVRGKRVLEIGCGTGILSVFAAQSGAREVVAIEQGSIADVAAEVFRANGCADRIELRRANSMDVVLERPCEVLIHELLGDQAIDENMLPLLADARERLLTPDAVLIPRAVRVCCVGLEAEDEGPFKHPSALRAELGGLGARYGVALAPFEARLGRRSRHLAFSPLRQPDGPPLPRRLGRECTLLDLDLRADPQGALRDHDALLPIDRDGRLGGLLVYFRAELDDETELSNAPDRPATSWMWNVRLLPEIIDVTAASELPLSVAVHTVAGEQMLDVRLRHQVPPG